MPNQTLTASRLRIMVVDDDPVDNEILQILLDDLAPEMVATYFSCPQEALDYFESTQEEFALILVDNKMPRIAGIDWIKAAKQSHTFPPPMYLMSSFLLDVDYQIIESHQIDGVLLKELSVVAFRKNLTETLSQVGLSVC